MADSDMANYFQSIFSHGLVVYSQKDVWSLADFVQMLLFLVQNIKLQTKILVVTIYTPNAKELLLILGDGGLSRRYSL